MLRGVLIVVLLLSLCTIAGPVCASPSQKAREELREELWLFASSYSPDEERDFEPLAPQCIKNGAFDRFVESRLRKNNVEGNWNMPEPCRTGQRYVEDMANLFFYIHLENATDGECSVETFVKGYTKGDGSHFYLKYEYYEFTEHTTASQPWTSVLPADFSENVFLADGERFPLTGLSNFIVRMRASRVDTRIRVSLRPLPLGIYQPPVMGIRFKTERIPTDGIFFDLAPQGAQHKDLRFTAGLLTHGTASMAKAMAEGTFTAVTVADVNKAKPLVLAKRNVQEPEGYSLERFHQESAQLYAVYNVYRRIAFSEIVMDWDSEKGRFIMVGKTRAKPISFGEFLKSMDFWSPECWRKANEKRQGR